MRRKAICARLTMGRVETRCSSGPFMYSSTSTKPLVATASARFQACWITSSSPMTTKNSIEPRLLAITKMLMERTWVSRM